MKISLENRPIGNKNYYSLIVFFDTLFACYYFSSLDFICYSSREHLLVIDFCDLYSDNTLHCSLDVSSCLSDVEDICKTFNIKVIE